MSRETQNLSGAELVRVHLRGKRVDLLCARLDIGLRPDDSTLRQAVECALGFTAGTLAGHRIDPGKNGNVTLRPRRRNPHRTGRTIPV